MSQLEDHDSMSQTQMQFSQVIPDPSEGPPSARTYEQNNLTSLDPSTQSRLVTDLSRLLLFKALSGEPIDRTKLAKEAWGDRFPNCKVVTNAALDKSVDRMRRVLGLDVKRVPEDQIKNLPKKFKDRMFVVNIVKDDEIGSHSKALHSVHLDNAIEKGLLMLVLSFIYCNGEVQSHVRWIPAAVLYRLLHSVDESIPAEPTTIKNKRESIGDLSSPSGTGRAKFDSSGVRSTTPDVDTLLDKFVHMDYLLKKKADKTPNGAAITSADEASFMYAMGPRTLLEIGRKQIIYFCAEVLDEQPDPTMLQELQEDGVEEMEEDER
jgi:DNA-binding winged helix-turn-helix (wHTH) protein